MKAADVTPEMLRSVSEHMRSRADAIAAIEAHDDFGRGQVRYYYRNLADALDREAHRAMVVEADRRQVQARRSWPEGWPPFSVLRRAYDIVDATPIPSVRWLERHGAKNERKAMLLLRSRWAEALAKVMAGGR
jgi:hypothetical protein